MIDHQVQLQCVYHIVLSNRIKVGLHLKLHCGRRDAAVGVALAARDAGVRQAECLKESEQVGRGINY